MCRATSEIWVAVSGTGIAGALTFLRLHWDAMRDRAAWRDAARRTTASEEGDTESDSDSVMRDDDSAGGSANETNGRD